MPTADAVRAFSTVSGPEARARSNRASLDGSDEFRKEQTRRGVLRSALGLALGLLLLLSFKIAGLTTFLTTSDWFMACLATVLVVGFLLLAVEREAYLELSWDPHFVYLPGIGALLLFTLQLYLAPEVRVLVLFGWFVVLLFMAGHAGFVGAVVLSSLMVLGYSAVIVLNYRGFLNLLFESALLVPFYLICIFTAFVLERMRRYREEMKLLRAELARQARTDALTALPNRRHFEETLEGELERCRRYGGYCSVAILDVDHFKKYNDSNGHLAGDAVLRALGDVLRSKCRTSDLAARYGGEEFALVMVSTGRRGALDMLERIREAVEEHGFAGQETQPTGTLTLSAGVATFPDDSSAAVGLMQRADEALYQAKREGRNRVCAASQGERVGEPSR